MDDLRKLTIIVFLFFSLFSYCDLRIVAVGDVMLGSTYPDQCLPTQKELEKITKELNSLMPEAEIKLFNLEGTLIEQGKPAKKGKQVYHFAIPPSYARYFKMMGFNVASINNNHIMDFGWEGCLNTMKILESHGINCTGPKGKIAEFSLSGRRIAIIAFGYLYDDRFYSILDIESSKQTIRALKRKHDIIIVSFHGGAEGNPKIENRMEEYLGEKRGNVVAFCRAVVDAGASLVIGHGPHLPRAIELYKGKLIVYSLGNFFTYGRFDIRGAYGYAPMLYVVLDNEGNFKEGLIIPFVQRGRGIPHYDKNGKAIRWIKGLTERYFPNTTLEINDDGSIKK